MQRWTYFAMGIMAGIIFVLGFLLLSQQPGNVVYASPLQAAAGDGGTYVVTGGTLQNQLDLIWVLQKDGDTTTLASYKMTTGKDKMELLSVRDISYDLKVKDYNSLPPVKDIKREIDRQAKEKTPSAPGEGK